MLPSPKTGTDAVALDPGRNAARENADVASSTDAYARRFAGAVGAWFLEVQARHTLDLLDSSQPGLRVLDVGGGHAQLVPFLIEAGHTVTVVGSDPSCGQRLKPWLGKRCRFEVGNLLALPYPERSFDAVISFRILSHVHSWERFLAELCRVADRSVMVDYASTRSVNVLARPLFPLKVRLEEERPRTFRVFRASELHEELGRNGFGVGGERPQFVFPMALHRALGSIGVCRSLEAAARMVALDRLLGSPVILRADRTP